MGDATGPVRRVDGRTKSRRLRNSARAADTNELLAGFRLDQERRNLSSATIGVRRQRLLSLAEDVFPASLVEVDRETIEAYLDARTLGPRARYTYISHLHAFYEWAVLEGLAAADPTLRIRRPRQPRLTPRPIRTEDLHRALDLAPPVVKAMIVLGAFQGLRAKEMAGLQREDVLEHQDPPVMIVSAGKGGHQRVLPLHPRTMPALHCAAMPRAGWVFVHDGAADRPYRPYEVSHAVAQFFDDVGIDATAHQLRHWFGTNVYARCQDLRVTQELLGHASPTTTMVYVGYSGVTARGAVEALDL